MKSIKTTACAVLLSAVILAGCSANETDTTTKAASSGSAETTAAQSDNGEAKAQDAASYTPGSTYIFEANGQKVSINMPAGDIEDKLGKAKSYFEAESCAFQGLDKTYTYNDFVVRTYPTDEKDYVASIELTDDIATTAEGAYIGMSADEVKDLYSEAPSSETDKALVYTNGDTKLSFILDGGNVSSITYTAAE